MERRFVISEDPCYVSEATDISESILKQRLLNIRFMLMKPVSEIDWSALFSILIHGEKEQEAPPSPEAAGPDPIAHGCGGPTGG